MGSGQGPGQNHTECRSQAAQTGSGGSETLAARTTVFLQLLEWTETHGTPPKNQCAATGTVAHRMAAFITAVIKIKYTPRLQKYFIFLYPLYCTFF